MKGPPAAAMPIFRPFFPDMSDLPPVVLPRARHRLARPGVWGWIWGLWFAVLCILSSLSHPGPKLDINGIDKVEHATYFAAGGACLAMALALRSSVVAGGPSWWRIAGLVLLAGAGVGWFDEWHQTFTPGRSGLDVYDWLADLTGSALAVPLARIIFRRVAAAAQRA
jgi:VanZ family protein